MAEILSTPNHQGMRSERYLDADESSPNRQASGSKKTSDTLGSWCWGSWCWGRAHMPLVCWGCLGRAHMLRGFCSRSWSWEGCIRCIRCKGLREGRRGSCSQRHCEEGTRAGEVAALRQECSSRRQPWRHTRGRRWQRRRWLPACTRSARSRQQSRWGSRGTTQGREVDDSVRISSATGRPPQLSV
jgi:hypothetical protein